MLGDLIKKAVGAATTLAKGHPVLAGLGIGAMILPRLFGGATSPQAMMGAQASIGSRIPPGGLPPTGMPPTGY
jgi:hypothetical protein